MIRKTVRIVVIIVAYVVVRAVADYTLAQLERRTEAKIWEEANAETR